MTDLLSDPQMAGTWTLDQRRSSIRFTARTLWGLVPVNGRFTDVTGEGHIGADGRVSGRLVVRTDSVRTGIGMRDHHLQAADFFDAERFPEIVVDVTGAAAGLTATLTIRGTTLPLPLTTTVTRPSPDSVAITARGEIDRTRWGVSGNMLGMMPPATTLVTEAVFTR